MQRTRAIFIIGTTAVGKTKLSIQLCKALNGEVINCDSKQLYRHADIMTAKADAQERQGIRHHMLDVLDLGEGSYNRNRYYQEAMAVVREVWARGKLPVIVGGTNYYLETLLYDMDIGEDDSEAKKQELNQHNSQGDCQSRQSVEKKQQCPITKEQIASMSKAQKYQQLQRLDPPMAQKLHPNDQTRVTSFLQRLAETGIPPSLSYKPYIHRLRFKQSLLFWIRNSNKNELHGLMETRIDKMVAGGGLVEALAVFRHAEVNGLEAGLGVLQAIGYKEFQAAYEVVRDMLQGGADYEGIYKEVQGKMGAIREKLEATKAVSIRSNKQVQVLERCKEILTKNTIDYSKRQVSWIKNRLFSCPDNRTNFFVLDLAGPANSDLMHRFETQVKQKALHIYHTVQKQGIGSIKQNESEFTQTKHCNINEWKKYKCQQCNIEANGDQEWREHLGSRRHRMGDKKQRKRAIKEERAKVREEGHKLEGKSQEEAPDAGKESQEQLLEQKPEGEQREKQEQK